MARTKHDEARNWRCQLNFTRGELAKLLSVNPRLISAMETGNHSNAKKVSDRAFHRYRLQCAGLTYENCHGRFRWD